MIWLLFNFFFPFFTYFLRFAGESGGIFTGGLSRTACWLKRSIKSRERKRLDGLWMSCVNTVTAQSSARGRPCQGFSPLKGGQFCFQIYNSHVLKVLSLTDHVFSAQSPCLCARAQLHSDESSCSKWGHKSFMVPLWRLQRNKNIHAWLYIPGLTQRFVFMPVVLHPTAVEGAKEQKTCHILLLYFKGSIWVSQCQDIPLHVNIAIVG